MQTKMTAIKPNCNSLPRSSCASAIGIDAIQLRAMLAIALLVDLVQEKLQRHIVASCTKPEYHIAITLSTM